MPAESGANGGARLAEAIAGLGVRTLFTLCGGHISPLLVGARRAGLRVVDVRDEAAAVFAADAAARLSGTVGVAAVTAGPGVTNALTALQNARLAQSPVLLIGGAAPTVLRGRGALQDIDQLSVVRPHVKWAASARRVRDLGPLCARAAAVAHDGVPGPVFLDCALDLLYDEDVVREWYGAAGAAAGRSLRARLEGWYLRRHVDRMFARAGEGRGPPRRPPVTAGPDGRLVGRARELLAAARRPLLLIGSQAVLDVGRVDRLAAAVAALGIPTYLSGMARGLLGRRHEVLRRHRRREALREADVVILAGVPCDFRLDYGRHLGRGARVVAANLSRAEARRNRRPTVTAVGDPGAFVTALGSAPPDPGAWAPWAAELAARDAAREAAIAAMATAPGDHVHPIALCRAVEDAAAADSVFVLDGGDFAATASYVLSPRGPLRHLDPGVFGTLGVGGGFALGAAAVRPGAEIWVLYGDGAAGFSLAEVDTCVRHGIPVIAVVGNDASWAQIARDQVAVLGDDVGTVLRRTDYHLVARGFGGEGLLVERAGDLPAALATAQDVARTGRPVLVNVLLDRTDFRKGSIAM
ncbi:MAG TPA: thiamine pyrophosphate-binding protein [Gemmatimonadales bacterium]|jgi:acetolactate synthase-1/2/3 large subunit